MRAPLTWMRPAGQARRRHLGGVPRLVTLALCIGPVATVHAQAPAGQPAAVVEKALAKAPVIDGHNDLPWEMRERVDYDFDRIDVSKPQPQLMTDIPRLRAGRVGGQFWSVYVPVDLQGDAAVSATLEQMDAVVQMARRYPSVFTIVRTADETERAMKAGRVASLIGVEGGHSIDSSLATLRMLHRLGAGYMTLTHSRNVPWADSTTDDPRSGGLSAFGEEVVREMNRLGMLVDLSHTHAETMADAVRVSKAPVIFSHSNARAVCDVPRNVPDAILKAVAANGGIVMATFVPGFVSPEVAAYNRTLAAETKALQSRHGGDAAALTAALDAWKAAHPEPRATVAQVADHIDHIRKVAGIDHIGLGGDFDGITSVVQGLEHVGTYPALLAELARRGYSENDLAKITSGNILRVMRAAEAVAASMKDVAPSIRTIEQVDHVTKRGQPVTAPAHTIVALGDSTTAGTPGFLSPIESPPDGSGDITSQYAWWLMQHEPAWRVLNRGVNRERTEAIAARLDRDVFAHSPGLLILLAGVNDVYDGDTHEAIQVRLQAMYVRALDAGIPVVACSIIPFDTATPEHLATLSLVNRWIRRTADDTPGMAFCDTHAAAAHPDAPERLRATPDGLHPSPAVYRLMADALAPVVREMLKQTRGARPAR